MAEFNPDGSILLSEGRTVFGDDTVLVGDFQELAQLLAPEPAPAKSGVAMASGPNFISGGGGRRGPQGQKGDRGVAGPQGPPGPSNGWVDDGATVRLETATDQVAIGAATTFGTEKLLVVGDARIDGSVQLLGGNTFFMESADGSTAPLSGPATGRIRYNNTTGTWQISTQGGAYADIATGSAGGNTLNDAYNQGGAGAGRTITATSGAVEINNIAGDATNALLVTRTAGTGAAIQVGSPGVARIFGDGDMVLGAAAMVGGERLRVVGGARIEGKLTVTGAIDPTSVSLSGGTAIFFESDNGVTAPLSAAAGGRIRYNNTTGTWQVSTQGGAYVDIVTGAGTSPWTSTGATIRPVVLTDEVSIGSAASAGKLSIFGDLGAQRQFFIRGAAGQSSNIIEVENSSATDLMVMDATGNVIIGGGLPTTRFNVRLDLAVAGAGTAMTFSNQAASTAGMGSGIIWTATNSAAAQASYLRIDAQLVTTTAGSEDGSINFLLSDSGVLITTMSMSYGAPSAAITLNSGNRDIDTIVQGDNGGSTPFYVDAGLFGGDGAVGVGTAPGGTELLDIVRPADTISAESRIMTVDSGTLTVDTSTADLRLSFFASVTLSPNGGVTVTNGSTLYVEGAPVNGGAGTLTNPFAIFSDAGVNRLDGGVLMETDVLLSRSAASTLEISDNAGGGVTVVPPADDVGSIGTGALRWSLVRATTITSGDLNLEDDESGARWTVKEDLDRIVAINRRTGKRYELAMKEIE